MKTYLFIVMLLCATLPACQAKDNAPSQKTQKEIENAANPKATEDAVSAELRQEIISIARKNNGGKEPTEEDLQNAMIQKTKQLADLFKNINSPKGNPSTTEFSNSVLPDEEFTLERKTKIRQEVYDLARKNNGGKEPTKQDLWKALVQKSRQAAGSTLDYGNYRKVPKGAKPEIVIKGKNIEINGKAVKIGGSLDSWKKAIAGNGNCKAGHKNEICDWDDLGLTVLANRGKSVFQFDVYLNFEQRESWESKPTTKYKPDYPFTGYLELDGYGIDAKTKYWEIESNIDPSRNLRCDFNDCSHPHGRSIDLRLNSNKEDGIVYELTISE